MRYAITNWLLRRPRADLALKRLKSAVYTATHPFAIQRQLDETEHRLSLVLCAATDTMSYCNYSWPAMKNEIAAKQAREYSIAYADAIDDAELTGAVAQWTKTERELWALKNPHGKFEPSDELAALSEFLTYER